MKSGKKENVTNKGCELEADTLADLPLTTEQAEQAKGGESRHTNGMNAVFCDGHVKW